MKQAEEAGGEQPTVWYDARKEYARLGLDVGQWRIAEANSTFMLCESYPRYILFFRWRLYLY